MKFLLVLNHAMGYYALYSTVRVIRNVDRVLLISVLVVVLVMVALVTSSVGPLEAVTIFVPSVAIREPALNKSLIHAVSRNRKMDYFFHNSGILN